MKDQTYPIPQYRGKKIGRLEIVDLWVGRTTRQTYGGRRMRAMSLWSLNAT